MIHEALKRIRVPQSIQVVVMKSVGSSQVVPLSGNKHRQFLLLKRTQQRGGFWQPITGRVEPGETFSEAALREITEETGLQPHEGRLIDLGYTHSYPLKPEWLVNYPPGTTHNDEAAFAFLVSSEPHIQLDFEEHETFAWCSFEAAQEKLVWHGNREALHRAAQRKHNQTRGCFEWKFGHRTLHLGQTTLLMGILNLTPDSFSHDGQLASLEKAVEQAFRLEAEGADILDIGGESTRPGATVVTAQEELDRIVPLLEKVRGKLRIPISVDTYKASVAEIALANGAEIINDISGLRFEPQLAQVVAKAKAGLVLMHSRGTPETLHGLPPVPNMLSEVTVSLQQSLQIALAAGISPEQLVLDPGIGFGKTLEDNVFLLNHLDQITELGFPLLVGTSRKSFLGKITGKDSPQDRIWGTAASVTISILHGAHIVRVHDLAPMRECAQVADAVVNEK